MESCSQVSADSQIPFSDYFRDLLFNLLSYHSGSIDFTICFLNSKNIVPFTVPSWKNFFVINKEKDIGIKVKLDNLEYQNINTDKDKIEKIGDIILSIKTQNNRVLFIDTIQYNASNPSIDDLKSLQQQQLSLHINCLGEIKQPSTLILKNIAFIQMNCDNHQFQFSPYQYKPISNSDPQNFNDYFMKLIGLLSDSSLQLTLSLFSFKIPKIYTCNSSIHLIQVIPSKGFSLAILLENHNIKFNESINKINLIVRPFISCCKNINGLVINKYNDKSQKKNIQLPPNFFSEYFVEYLNKISNHFTYIIDSQSKHLLQPKIDQNNIKTYNLFGNIHIFTQSSFSLKYFKSIFKYYQSVNSFIKIPIISHIYSIDEISNNLNTIRKNPYYWSPDIYTLIFILQDDIIKQISNIYNTQTQSLNLVCYFPGIDYKFMNQFLHQCGKCHLNIYTEIALEEDK
jgi:hypothetical protein